MIVTRELLCVAILAAATPASASHNVERLASHHNGTEARGHALANALSPCVHTHLQRGRRFGIVPLPAKADPWLAEWATGTGISHVYILHYTGNKVRRLYQEHQIPQLGLNASIVTAFDHNEINASLRSCTALCDPANVGVSAGGKDANISICSPVRAARLSASLKLYVALYDMAHRAFPAALVLEDDCRIVWVHLHALGIAVRNTSRAPESRLTIMFSSSYTPSGADGLCCAGDQAHVHLRPNDRHGYGLMPAVGVVITAEGARHLLHSLPIADHNDVLLSDRRGAAARQSGLWYVKPYAFLPAPELQHECMGDVDLANGALGKPCKPMRLFPGQTRPAVNVRNSYAKPLGNG